jgi:hypothetical protein
MLAVVSFFVSLFYPIIFSKYHGKVYMNKDANADNLFFLFFNYILLRYV